MFARIGVMRALNRGHVREFIPAEGCSLGPPKAEAGPRYETYPPVRTADAREAAARSASERKRPTLRNNGARWGISRHNAASHQVNWCRGPFLHLRSDHARRQGRWQPRFRDWPWGRLTKWANGRSRSGKCGTRALAACWSTAATTIARIRSWSIPAAGVMMSGCRIRRFTCSGLRPSRCRCSTAVWAGARGHQMRAWAPNERKSPSGELRPFSAWGVAWGQGCDVCPTHRGDVGSCQKKRAASCLLREISSQTRTYPADLRATHGPGARARSRNLYFTQADAWEGVWKAPRLH